MPTPLSIAADTFDTFCREVIAPSVVLHTAPLQAEAFQCLQPVTWHEARAAAYAPVNSGWHWGPAWSTAWFRLRGKASAAMAGLPAHLRFPTDNEALLWLGGAPAQGLSINCDTALLSDRADDRQEIEVHVEAACNHLFGAAGLAWEAPEVHQRWQSPTPGRFHGAELVTIDESVRALKVAYSFATGLMRELAPQPGPGVTPAAPWSADQPMWQSSRAEELHTALRRATDLLTLATVPQAAPAALAILRECLSRSAGASTTICHAVGHAHIDTAWLWPLRETRRKCLRTFSSVLRLMDRFPAFSFMCSQPQQYAMVERDSPELFARIARSVADGRWEPIGAMWVEPDCNIPGGESLVRQVLHGVGYFSSRFGPRGAQRLLFLPDTFGFPPCLPQIMKRSGLDTFVTNKLSWNETNPFPHTTFWWEGLDGSRVLAHCTPGGDYNAVNTPRELIRGDRCHRSKQIPSVLEGGRHGGSRWLQPFGFGDGGGGPTDWSIEHAALAADCDGLPRVRLGPVGAFCDGLHADVRAAAEQATTVPVHHGELYLELHRGTYTTHARFKQLHRSCEERLRLAELALVCRMLISGSDTGERAHIAEARKALAEAWRTVLLNQFHDILPGSSITRVYQEGTEQLRGVLAECRRLLNQSVAATAAALDDSSLKRPVVVLNGRTHPCESEVAGSGPPLSVSVVDAGPNAHPGPAPTVEMAETATLRNGLVWATINRRGQVVGLGLGDGDEAGASIAAGPMNRLALYPDRPRMWDAWDIDEPRDTAAHWQDEPADAFDAVTVEDGGAGITMTRRLGADSEIVQTFTMKVGEPWLRIHTEVSWQENRRLLRAVFPTVSRSPHAWFATQHGRLSRPTHRNTSIDRARFEVPAQGWCHLPGADGLLVICPDRYGWSCSGGQIGLSLLRAPMYPDATADRGDHAFDIFLAPGIQEHDVAATVERASRGTEIYANIACRHNNGRRAITLASIRPINGASSESVRSVVVDAIKPAENDDRIIIRLGERLGQRVAFELVLPRELAARPVNLTDLLERPLSSVPAASDGSLRLELGAFELMTLAIG